MPETINFQLSVSFSSNGDAGGVQKCYVLLWVTNTFSHPAMECGGLHMHAELSY